MTNQNIFVLINVSFCFGGLSALAAFSPYALQINLHVCVWSELFLGFVMLWKINAGVALFSIVSHSEIITNGKIFILIKIKSKYL